jgi:hypothetical protein
MADRLVYQIGSLPCFNPPRLHRQRISRHDDMIGEPAATLGAAEAQILQRAVALPGIDDSLQISRRLVAAGFALHGQAQIGLRQHAARGR